MKKELRVCFHFHEGSPQVVSNLNTAELGFQVSLTFISSVCLTSPCVWLAKFASVTELVMRKVKANLDIFDFPLPVASHVFASCHQRFILNW